MIVKANALYKSFSPREHLYVNRFPHQPIYLTGFSENVRINPL